MKIVKLNETLVDDEKQAKDFMIDYLKKQGYVTYAYILEDLDFNLTEDPDTIGFMDVRTGAITINRNLAEDAASFVVRHEICHSYLQHEMRLVKQLAKHLGLDYNKLTAMNIASLHAWLHKDSLQNVVADFDISNNAYTDEDKRLAKSIELNGRVLQGLVTELDHPGWENLSLEDMFEEALKEQKEKEDELADQMQDGQEDDSNDGSGNGGGGNGMPSVEPIIIKGTFKDGQFYDENGQLISH